jgi:hypothetical protein
MRPMFVQMVITSDVAGQLLTKKYRREKIFGKPEPPNPLRAAGSVFCAAFAVIGGPPQSACIDSELTLPSSAVFRPDCPVPSACRRAQETWNQLAAAEMV